MVTYCRRVHVQGTFQTFVARPMAQHESSRVVKHGPAKNLLGRNTAQQRLFDRNSVHKNLLGRNTAQQKILGRNTAQVNLWIETRPRKPIGPKHGPGKYYWAETRPR
jgi:hypothetical protein